MDFDGYLSQCFDVVHGETKRSDLCPLFQTAAAATAAAAAAAAAATARRRRRGLVAHHRLRDRFSQRFECLRNK